MAFQNSTGTFGFQNIEGVKSLTLKNGEATFSPLAIFSKPDTEVFFKATTPFISKYYTEYFQNNTNLSDFNFNQNYYYIFSITFRDCIIGEIFLSQINRLIFI